VMDKTGRGEKKVYLPLIPFVCSGARLCLERRAIIKTLSNDVIILIYVRNIILRKFSQTSFV
jgi:hypothetical protein